MVAEEAAREVEEETEAAADSGNVASTRAAPSVAVERVVEGMGVAATVVERVEEEERVVEVSGAEASGEEEVEAEILEAATVVVGVGARVVEEEDKEEAATASEAVVAPKEERAVVMASEVVAPERVVVVTEAMEATEAKATARTEGAAVHLQACSTGRRTTAGAVVGIGA